MIVDLEHKTRDGVRFKHSDKEWLQDTVNFDFGWVPEGCENASGGGG
jgi:hypothetical protein